MTELLENLILSELIKIKAGLLETLQILHNGSFPVTLLCTK